MKNQSVIYKLDLQLFAEDPKSEEKEEKNLPTPEENAVETLKKLKENTVSKEKYLEVVRQNKELWEANLNGERLNQEEEKKLKKEPTIQELREDLYGGKKRLSNLDYWDKTLKLRKAIMDKGGADPFVANGRKAKASTQDFIRAEAIAEAMQECVDAADGDPAAFNLELHRRGL